MEAIKWQDHPDYKNLYESEISLLQNGLGGDFELVELLQPAQDGRITATGWLRYGPNNERQPVRIVFPTKYPFRQPVVYPLVKDQNDNIIQQPMVYGKGNQYGTGGMCLMRKDQWDRQQDNIGSYLRRAQRWLNRASSEEGFPKDEIVEEIPAMLPHAGQVIMGRCFQVPLNAKTGIITLTQFKPNYFILEENVLPVNPFLLKINKETFKWYAFDPGYTFQTLFPFFSLQAVLAVLKTHFGEEPQALLATPNIGFYIPDDACQWHFFKFSVLNGQAFTGNVSYFITRIIEKELYHRTRDVFNDQVLQNKKVTIIGLGAIGSEVSRSLARNGVGHFNLFDNDTFEVGNSVRHAADLFYIGENKTSVVRQLILRSNPNITVVEHPNIDVLDDDGFLEKSLQNSDMCIVLTAEDSVDYLINELYATRINIPFVFARVSAGGVSGSIQVVKHNETACLRCLTKYGADILPTPKHDKEYNELGPEYGSCSTPAVPGSEIDTKEIALQVSRISMQILLEESDFTYAERLGDQYYWHGPFGSKEQAPFTWEIKKLEKHKDCEFCNPQR